VCVCKRESARESVSEIEVKRATSERARHAQESERASERERERERERESEEFIDNQIDHRSSVSTRPLAGDTASGRS